MFVYNRMNKYDIRYGSLLFVLLFLLPVGSYGAFVSYDIIGAKPVFPSLIVWCALTIAGWLLALFFLLLVDIWDYRGDQALDKLGISQSHKIEIIWNFVILPSLLGALIFMCTLVDRRPAGQEFTTQRILALFLGFVPVGTYGFFRARQLTKHILHGEKFKSMSELPRYLRTKWRYPLIIGITLLLTPFFGAGLIIGDVWRYAPRSRKVVVPTTLVLGIVIGLILTQPLVQQMRRGLDTQATWLYFTINLFAGVAYVLLWRGVFLSELYQQRD